MPTLLMAWKPRFMTSHDCLQILKREHHFKKLGHTGTLDPLACGLMGILADDNTKFQHDLQKTSKTYHGKIYLGVETDSWDALGLPLKVSPVPKSINIEELESFLRSLTQIQPPKVSAIKIKGKKALASEITQEEMTLRDFKLIDVILDQISPNEIHIKAEVGGGTYIRSIAQEIGKFLNCGAFLSELKRVKHHNFELEGNLFDPCNIVGEVTI